MGNITSQYMDEWQVVQMQDGSGKKDQLTPNNKNTRSLPTDPRSPTSAIRRTPIQVEKTPQKKSLYTALDSSDENKLDFDECDIGEEACEVTTLQDANETAVKTAGNAGCPTKPRSPLKKISKKKMDSPGMYLRYKQIKEVREGYLRQFQNRTNEMNDTSDDK